MWHYCYVVTTSFNNVHQQVMISKRMLSWCYGMLHHDITICNDVTVTCVSVCQCDNDVHMSYDYE